MEKLIGISMITMINLKNKSEEFFILKIVTKLKSYKILKIIVNHSPRKEAFKPCYHFL